MTVRALRPAASNQLRQHCSSRPHRVRSETIHGRHEPLGPFPCRGRGPENSRSRICEARVARIFENQAERFPLIAHAHAQSPPPQRRVPTLSQASARISACADCPRGAPTRDRATWPICTSPREAGKADQIRACVATVQPRGPFIHPILPVRSCRVFFPRGSPPIFMAAGASRLWR